MNKLLRRAIRIVLPLKIKNHIDFFSYLKKNIDHPKVLKEVHGTRILSLSPHPDDDVLSCGGTLYIHKRKGSEIVSVCMTDGRKGAEGAYSEDDLVNTRKEETRRSAKILGISEVFFLGERDRELAPTPSVIVKLINILDNFSPTSIFFPSVIDGHPDHMATNAILYRVLQKYKGTPPMCYQYETWTPILPNCMVDITDVSEVKTKAIEEFQSQLRMANIMDAMFGLAKYRSVFLNNGDRFAESFLETTTNEYLRLFKIVNH